MFFAELQTIRGYRGQDSKRRVLAKIQPLNYNISGYSLSDMPTLRPPFRGGGQNRFGQAPVFMNPFVTQEIRDNGNSRTR